MKKLLFCLLLVSVNAAMANTPAMTTRVDLTGLKFENYCTGEPATITTGDLGIVFRPDFGGDVNGVHILNKVAGQFSAMGDVTGNQYLVNIAAQSPANLPGVSISNFVNGSGVANLLVHVEMINLSDPGSGISRVAAVIVFVTDGTGDGNQRVLKVSMDCIGA